MISGCILCGSVSASFLDLRAVFLESILIRYIRTSENGQIVTCIQIFACMYCEDVNHHLQMASNFQPEHVRSTHWEFRKESLLLGPPLFDPRYWIHRSSWYGVPQQTHVLMTQPAYAFQYAHGLEGLPRKIFGIL